LETTTITKTLNEIYNIVPHLVKLPETKMSLDYDKEVDTLYISFKRPQKANDSEMLSNGILLRYKDKEIVGITILDASKR
jgi:uncharacterized protein YuzE